MKIQCNIDGFQRNKKSGKVTLTIADEIADESLSYLSNFMKKPVTIEVLVDKDKFIEDSQKISDEQRKKVYALYKDFGKGYGETPENAKAMLKQAFIDEHDLKYFSLADCTSEMANYFIEFIIRYAQENGVDLGEEYRNKELGFKLARRMCFICGENGEVLNQNAKQICLCEKHKSEAMMMGYNEFTKQYHVQAI